MCNNIAYNVHDCQLCRFSARLLLIILLASVFKMFSVVAKTKKIKNKNKHIYYSSSSSSLTSSRYKYNVYYTRQNHAHLGCCGDAHT